jgi:hypothetical protein
MDGLLSTGESHLQLITHKRNENVIKLTMYNTAAFYLSTHYLACKKNILKQCYYFSSFHLHSEFPLSQLSDFPYMMIFVGLLAILIWCLLNCNWEKSPMNKINGVRGLLSPQQTSAKMLRVPPNPSDAIFSNHERNVIIVNSSFCLKILY